MKKILCVLLTILLSLNGLAAYAQEPAPTQRTLQSGSRGDDVLTMKRRLRELIAQHVKTHMGARCLAVTEAGVQVEGPDGSVQLIPADTVAVALGMRANDTGELEALVQRAGVPCHRIGDCVRARKIYDAVSEGYLTALSL